MNPSQVNYELVIDEYPNIIVSGEFEYFSPLISKSTITKAFIKKRERIDLIDENQQNDRQIDRWIDRYLECNWNVKWKFLDLPSVVV